MGKSVTSALNYPKDDNTSPKLKNKYPKYGQRKKNNNRNWYYTKFLEMFQKPNVLKNPETKFIDNKLYVQNSFFRRLMLKQIFGNFMGNMLKP